MFIAKLIKSIRHPNKAWRFFHFMLRYNFRRKHGTLFIIGLDSGGVFSLMYRGYEKCYCFEANPSRFQKLQKKYSKYQHIKLFNVAVAQFTGEIKFNISSNNNGASSSIGNFKDSWQKQFKRKKIEMIKSIIVPCINLHDFCKENDINFIDDYISDIQGMDLEVLKTMEPMIVQKKIKTITCEVTKDEQGNIYSDLPDNSKSGFERLLNRNYKLISTGWGILKDNRFEPIPENAWEMDCKWILRD